jgi:hypothetical protein
MHFGNLSAGAEDDSDGDGVSNLKEFTFGSNPVAANTMGVTRLEYRQFERKGGCGGCSSGWRRVSHCWKRPPT